MRTGETPAGRAEPLTGPVATVLVLGLLRSITVLVSGCLPDGKMDVNSEVSVSGYGSVTRTVDIVARGWFAEP